jgi:hypothetical protein
MVPGRRGISVPFPQARGPPRWCPGTCRVNRRDSGRSSRTSATDRWGSGSSGTSTAVEASSSSRLLSAVVSLCTFHGARVRGPPPGTNVRTAGSTGLETGSGAPAPGTRQDRRAETEPAERCEAAAPPAAGSTEPSRPVPSEWRAVQVPSRSPSSRTIGQAPSDQFEMTVYTMEDEGSCRLVNETPASYPSSQAPSPVASRWNPSP